MLIDGSPPRAPERAADTNKDLGATVNVVTEYIAPSASRHLPHMLVATTLVAVLPLAVSLGLRASGAISAWVSMGLAVVMSLASSMVGSAYWRNRGGHGEVLFSELLLWGWIRSWRQERELANASRLLDLVNLEPARGAQPDELTVERREQLLRQLAGALEGQDVYLNGHSRRVARHATMIARGMGLPNEEVARIRAAAAVHDVGKLLTPKAVLNKPGRLTDEEFDVIKRHPVDGAEMIAALGDPELTRIVRHHHERLDGAGYPDGLRGEEIPLGARVIAVADTFDAVTSARPYRDAAPHQKAIDILRKEAGTQLDPNAVRAFLAHYSGSRPTVVWAVITSSLRRVISWLTGDPAAAATISAGKVAAATVATATIGAVAAAAPVPVVHHAPRPAVAHRAPTPAHGVATARRSQGLSLSVAVPASRGGASRVGASRPAAATPARTRRRTHHAAAAKGHAHPNAVRPGPHRAGSSSIAANASPGQGAASRAQTGAGARTSQPSPSTSGGRRKGSKAGKAVNTGPKAYGHTKPLGKGLGKGAATGHNSPTSTSTGQSNRTGHANQQAGGRPTTPGSAAGQGNPSSHSDANSQGNGSSSASATTTPASTGSTGQGNDGAGNGHSAGKGHGTSAGNG